MIRIIILIIPFIYSLGLFAQEVELSDNQFNINLLPLTLSYERKIDVSKSFTLSGGVAYSFEYSTYSGPNGTITESSFYTAPFFSASFRNYYTRKRVKKELNNNSGNYLGVLALYTLGPLSENKNSFVHQQIANVYSLGPVWGIQRNYKSGVHLGLSLGLAIQGGEFIENSVQTTGSFELGFRLSSN